MSVKILIVDDSRVERNFLAGMLKKLGAEPITTESCDEGTEAACLERFDLLFIDYFMPEADGVHTLREIRQNERSKNADTPAVALGTSDSASDSDFFAEHGFVNYIEKPVDPDVLHAALILYLPEEKRREIGTAVSETEKEQTKLSVLPEWLGELTELSTEDGIRNCGTEEDYLGALKIFHRSIESMSDEIEGYYDTGDLKNYTIKVHALKSSARIIGLSELSELAKQLEAAGDREDTQFIEQNTGTLLELYRGYREKLSRLSEDNKARKADKPPADKDFLDDAFSSLDDFAGQMDYDLVEMVVDSVREYSLGEREQAIFDEIDEAFMELDWNRIRTAARKYFEDNEE